MNRVVHQIIYESVKAHRIFHHHPHIPSGRFICCALASSPTDPAIRVHGPIASKSAVRLPALTGRQIFSAPHDSPPKPTQSSHLHPRPSSESSAHLRRAVRASSPRGATRSTRSPIVTAALRAYAAFFAGEKRGKRLASNEKVGRVAHAAAITASQRVVNVQNALHEELQLASRELTSSSLRSSKGKSVMTNLTSAKRHLESGDGRGGEIRIEEKRHGGLEAVVHCETAGFLT